MSHKTRNFEAPLNQVLLRRETCFELFRMSHYKRKIQKHRMLNYLYRMARLNVCVSRNFDFRQLFYTFVIHLSKTRTCLRASRPIASKTKISTTRHRKPQLLTNGKICPGFKLGAGGELST